MISDEEPELDSPTSRKSIQSIKRGLMNLVLLWSSYVYLERSRSEQELLVFKLQELLAHSV